MKKIMIAAAIVCAACISQAAQVAWGNTTASKLADLTGATMTAANATAYALSVSLVDAEGNAVITSTGINNMSAGVLSGNTNWSYTFGDGEGEYNTGDLFSIVATMTVAGQQYEMVVAENLAITAQNNSGTDTFSWAAGSYGGLSETPTVGKWSAVPEPTSGLLMLLGMAGLALRRKQA